MRQLRKTRPTLDRGAGVASPRGDDVEHHVGREMGHHRCLETSLPIEKAEGHPDDHVGDHHVDQHRRCQRPQLRGRAEVAGGECQFIEMMESLDGRK